MDKINFDDIYKDKKEGYRLAQLVIVAARTILMERFGYAVKKEWNFYVYYESKMESVRVEIGREVMPMFTFTLFVFMPGRWILEKEMPEPDTMLVGAITKDRIYLKENPIQLLFSDVDINLIISNIFNPMNISEEDNKDVYDMVIQPNNSN